MVTEPPFARGTPFANARLLCSCSVDIVARPAHEATGSREEEASCAIDFYALRRP
jgi:hypothetical protein